MVVTGMGLATPLELDVESSWESLREGRGGVGPVTRFDAGSFATRIAAELKGFALSRDLGGDASRWESHTRNTRITLAVAAQAIRHSGLFEGMEVDRSRFGVYLGSGEGQADFPRFAELVRIRPGISSRYRFAYDVDRVTQRGETARMTWSAMAQKSNG